MNDNRNLPDSDFQQIRNELNIPREFPPDVLAKVEISARREVLAEELADLYLDLTRVPFITIDPPGSRDLDQALFIQKQGEGYIVRYAIADVAFFVERGGVIEHEAWSRGQTLYSPDLKTPLYPPALSEGGASLLSGSLRPAVVFTFILGSRAEVASLDGTRAIVRSRAQLAYPEVSEHLARERQQLGSGSLAGQEWSHSLSLLEEVGRKRQVLEAERGGVSLRIPAQQVQRWTAAVTGYRLAFETSSDVEEWNAQVSLMTGIAAAELMIQHGVGLLRSLAPPRADRLRALKLTARALGVAWPAGMDYDDFVRSLDPRIPTDAVILHQAAMVTGGARYVAFFGDPKPQDRHAGIAAFYAHATAPLRRLADRYVLDLLVSLSSKAAPDQSLLVALQKLPKIMAASDGRSHRLESRILDCVEARLLHGREGEIFAANVIALRADGVVVQIADPPIRTLVPASVFASEGQTAPAEHVLISEDGAVLRIGRMQVTLGQTLLLRLDSADPMARTLTFSVNYEQ
jgi:exoribonuclease R